MAAGLNECKAWRVECCSDPRPTVECSLSLSLTRTRTQQSVSPSAGLCGEDTHVTPQSQTLIYWWEQSFITYPLAIWLTADQSSWTQHEILRLLRYLCRVVRLGYWLVVDNHIYRYAICSSGFIELVKSKAFLVQNGQFCGNVTVLLASVVNVAFDSPQLPKWGFPCPAIFFPKRIIELGFSVNTLSGHCLGLFWCH